jgi:hypothetical protein
MLLSDSVGGAEESRKGFWKAIPVKLTARVADMSGLLRREIHGSCGRSGLVREGGEAAGAAAWGRSWSSVQHIVRRAGVQTPVGLRATAAS